MGLQLGARYLLSFPSRVVVNSGTVVDVTWTGLTSGRVRANDRGGSTVARPPVVFFVVRSRGDS